MKDETNRKENDKQQSNQNKNNAPTGDAPAASDTQKQTQQEDNTMLSWDEFNSDESISPSPVMQSGFTAEPDDASSNGSGNSSREAAQAAASRLVSAMQQNPRAAADNAERDFEAQPVLAPALDIPATRESTQQTAAPASSAAPLHPVEQAQRAVAAIDPAEGSAELAGAAVRVTVDQKAMINCRADLNQLVPFKYD